MLEDSHSSEAQPLFMETFFKIPQNPTWVSGLFREATLPKEATLSREATLPTKVTLPRRVHMLREVLRSFKTPLSKLEAAFRSPATGSRG